MKKEDKAMANFLKEVSRPISSIKSKPKLAWTVSPEAIEKLNAHIAEKLEQNKKERIASILDVEGKVFM